MNESVQLSFQFVLKIKVYWEKKFIVISKKAWNPSKMASDQNEKFTIGISIVENLVQGNYSPQPWKTRKITK
jgi:hypothetical protein